MAKDTKKLNKSDLNYFIYIQYYNQRAYNDNNNKEFTILNKTMLWLLTWCAGNGFMLYNTFCITTLTLEITLC